MRCWPQYFSTCLIRISTPRLRDQEVAGSNPVAPTILDSIPFRPIFSTGRNTPPAGAAAGFRSDRDRELCRAPIRTGALEPALPRRCRPPLNARAGGENLGQRPERGLFVGSFRHDFERGAARCPELEQFENRAGIGPRTARTMNMHGRLVVFHLPHDPGRHPQMKPPLALDDHLARLHWL